MQNNVVSAVFDSQNEAESAIRDLRSAGVTDASISVIGKHEGSTTETTGSGENIDNHDEPASLISKVAAGSGIGALLGVAALAIPGVGPLVAAGAIAESAIGGAALAGTAAGAAAGGLTDILTKHGVSSEDSSYYHDRINQGGIFVSVDPSSSSVQRDELQDILHRAGGHNAGRSRSA
jgi:hypothetical protein